MRFIITIAILLFHLELFSQLSVGGVPKSFNIKKKAALMIPEKQLDSLNVQQLIKEDSLEGIPNRYATLRQVDIDIKRDGIKTIIEEGTIWQYSFSAPNALSIGIAFSQYYIPEGATLFIYNKEKSIVLGAFTSLNNKENHFLKIAELFSEDAVIEYFEPKDAAFSGSLAISYITLAYRSISGVLQTTNLDVNCPEWDELSTVKHAICKMTFVSGQYSYICTGSLINNTKNDGTPFFLTAHHCISTESSAQSLVTYFNYEAPVCGGAAPRTYQTLSGSTLCGTLEATDFTLLRLTETPPASYNPFYAGWNVSGKVEANVYGIHHPEGNVKKVAYSQLSIRNISYSIGWEEGNSSPPSSHWGIKFTTGATKGGSSGSPLLNSRFQILGQLHGGDNNNDNFYGKISLSWGMATSSVNKLKTWLDPTNSGITELNGILAYSIPKAGFTSNPEKACTMAAIDLQDTSLYTPTSWNWQIDKSSDNFRFLNGSGSSSRNPQIEFLRPDTYNISLTVTNAFGSSTYEKQMVVSDRLDFKITESPGNEICAYELNNKLVKASGAANYAFELLPSTILRSTTLHDSLLLILPETNKNQESFTQNIIAHGSHGNCVATDTVTFKVYIPKNDLMRYSEKLNTGLNGPFNNHCTSIEQGEPHPDAGGCQTQYNWCPDPNNKDVINKTLWFQIKAPLNGNINIDTKGTDTRIALYEATNYQDLYTESTRTLIAANDNAAGSDVTASLKDISVTPLQTYWLQVDAYKGQEGLIFIHLYNNDIEIGQNPTSGIFNFTLARETEGNGTIEVYSTLGSLVYKKALKNSPEITNYQIDLSNFTSGLYNLVVTVNGDRYIRKIVLVKR